MTSSSEAPAKTAASNVGLRKLGKYELQRQLGAGGMGAVYLAKDTQLKRLVALKILPKDKADNATLVRRFQTEAQAAAQLKHENIVAIYDSGEIDGFPYIAMEFVDGVDVQELIRKRGKLPVKRALDIVKQVAKALQHAYEHNIVHRDIKPSNLLVRNDGLVKVTDLGLARSVDDTLETNITRAGTTVGTVDYMSPEQGRNSKAADIRSDIYSLGCTWYHMLTGLPPFPDGSMTNKLQAHAVKPPPDPRIENELVPEAAVAVLHRMMAKRPEDRYQTPEELLQDLARPSLTRAGAEEEVLAAISESETAEIAPEAKPAKRTVKPGVLPPKKKSAQEKPDKESFLNWETIQPILWGGLILGAIVGLGLLVAAMSGNLDFGGRPVARPDQGPAPQDAASPAGSPAAGGPVAASAPTSVSGPSATIVAAGDANVVGAPSTGSISATGASIEPSTLNPNAVAPAVDDPVARTFDPTALPEWSAPSLSGSGQATREPTTKSPQPPSPAPGKTPAPTQPGGRSPAANLPGSSIPGEKPTASETARKVVTVGPGAKTDSHFASLVEALRAIPASGGVIRFTGAGPFELTSVPLSLPGRLILEAAEGTQPIILVKPAAKDSTAGLQLTGGSLDVNDVHFVLDRAVFSGSDAVNILSVVDGELTVRRATFTVWGDGPASVRAIHVDSQLEPKGMFPPLEPRLLVEQVMVRGDGVTALAVARPCADVVVRESLFACSSDAVVRLSGKLPVELSPPSAAKPRRAVRFFQSTLYGRRAVFRVSADDALVPPSTAIALHESICASSGDGALLQAVGWPVSSAAVEGKGRLAGLSWWMKDSAALGFGRLADVGDGAFRADDLDGWQSLWNSSFPAAQFSAAAWPAADIAELSSARPADFDRETVSVRGDNASPGCDVKLLTVPTSLSRRRFTALAAKPTFPAPDFQATASQVVQIDASKLDVGRELQNGTWPPGTLIEITGAGLKAMSPVTLKNKSWKIAWRSQEGTPLILTPKSVTGDVDSLIHVDGGSLELANLRFQVSTTKKSKLDSLISSSNARLTLDNVNLLGVLTDAEAIDSLLHWSGMSSAAVLACKNSTFVGSGRLVRLDLGAGPAFFTNCLLVSRGDALDVRIPATAEGAAGTLSADHVTFSATMGVIQLRRETPDGARPAHRFYFDQCVFAPPLPARANEAYAPTLFSLANPADDLTGVEWWGTSNGVAPEVTTLIRGEKEKQPDAKRNGLERWKATWAEEQDVRFLTGAGGVVLNEPNLGKAGPVKPGQFALHPSSKAYKWGDDGAPIGIDVARIESPPAAVKPKVKEPPKTPNKGASLPDF